jgi:hypothetical protein
VGFAVGIYLLNRRKKNDLTMACLIFAYSSMQLWESLMWYDQKCGAINIAGTKLAYIALWSHVLAIGIGLYYEYNTMVPMYIGIGLMALAIFMCPAKWNCSKPGENKHLVWGFNPDFYMLVFSIAIALCLYYIKPLKTAVVISSLFLTSFLISYILNSKYKTTGSFWCWVCAFFCFVFIKLN